MAEVQHKLLKELEVLARIRKEDVASIIARAVEIGVDKLKAEVVLDQYLKGEIGREEAIKEVVIVKLAEKQ